MEERSHEMVTISIDATGDWMPVETDEAMHDRVFRMTKMASEVFGWGTGSDEFFENYHKFLAIAEKGREHHKQLVLMSLLTLQELFERADIGFIGTFEGEDSVDAAFRKAVRRLMYIYEQSLFSGEPAKSNDLIDSMPESITTVDFTFIREHTHDLPSQEEAYGGDSETLNSLFENLDIDEDPDEIERLLDLWYNDDTGETQ